MSKISEARVQMIGAQSARWPNHTTGHHWQKLWAAIDATRDIVREADREINAVEANRDLSVEGKRRRMSSIAMTAVSDLDGLSELGAAEQAVASWAETLDGRKARIGKPSEAFDIALQAEIRGILRSKGPKAASFALEHRSDPAMASAVATAPAFLSGMTNEAHAVFVQAAESAMSPEVVAQRQQLDAALEVARKAIVQAKGAIAQRGQLVKVSDGYKAAA